jgi:hypothetical protein
VRSTASRSTFVVAGARLEVDRESGAVDPALAVGRRQGEFLDHAEAGDAGERDE